jgi:hypothetical protein
MVGRVELAGPAKEYITGGRRIVLAPNTRWTAEAAAAGDLTLRTQISSGGSWEISLSTPRGEPFMVRRYVAAVRHGFTTVEQPGLAVTGDGRGCNESKGEFTVQEISLTPDGKLRRLRAIVRQRCGGSAASLNGTIDLRGASDP